MHPVADVGSRAGDFGTVDGAVPGGDAPAIDLRCVAQEDLAVRAEPVAFGEDVSKGLAGHRVGLYPGGDTDLSGDL